MEKINKTDVFKFMSVRSPQNIEEKKLSKFYIQDDYISEVGGRPTRTLREILSANSSSAIGKIVFNKIFCEPSDNNIKDRNHLLIGAILELLEPKSIQCEVSRDVAPDSLINEMERRPYIFNDNKYYLLPINLEDIQGKLDLGKLIAAKNLIEKHSKVFEKNELIKGLHGIFEVKLLYSFIFEGSSYNGGFHQMKTDLFETLYLLYVLRRITSINLEYVIRGLQILHVIEWLAIDEFLILIKAGKLDINKPSVAQTIVLLQNIFPELREINFSQIPEKFSFINSKDELIEYLQSTPIIHPIFAKLHWYKNPFNEIKPIGIGDLKVVKQWLCGYQAGEISHIHNIMKGEIKERNHRHLEKTEEVFSFSSEQSEDTQKESQTTERFEVKREAEKVIKSDLNVGAHTDFTYNGTGITYNLGGNFSYGSSSQDTQRTASNFARDVMDKAVTQIQRKTRQERSVTKIFETEETNKHTLDNSKGEKHTSGIYRWLDKKYKAQIYNYGKRLMFEFIIPEPAAFYIKSKLCAAEFEIDTPKKPEKPDYKEVRMEIEPDKIDSIEFNRLRKEYDLAEFTFPTKKKTLAFIDQATGNNDFNGNQLMGLMGDNQWSARGFNCKHNVEGYLLTKVFLEGEAFFKGSTSFTAAGTLIPNPVIPPAPLPLLPPVHAPLGGLNQPEPGSVDTPKDLRTENTLVIFVNGIEVFREKDNNKILFFHNNTQIVLTAPQPGEVDLRLIDDKDISLTFRLRDGEYFQFSMNGEFELSPGVMLDWQTGVYNKIKSIKKQLIDKENQELEIAYNSQLADYRNKMSELNALTVNDIIQGRSEAYNREVIRQELKKHCITMIAREFDTVGSDDVLSKEDALENEKVSITYDKFFAGEVSVNSGTPATNIKDTKTVVGFEPTSKVVDYPKININTAKKKAPIIQFLEQAFEWQQIAYIFYPYFWAVENKWIELMNRLDYTDSNMTAFLRAGSVRVLIAVTPSYDEAVMHFLATREPWEGGPVPVLGDPLFLPIFEEMRKQQDDLYNAKPDDDKEWYFEVPTSLVYLHDSSSPIPDDFDCEEN